MIARPTIALLLGITPCFDGQGAAGVDEMLDNTRASMGRVLLESHPAMTQVLAILSPNMLSSVGTPAPQQPGNLPLPTFPFAPPTGRRS